MRKYKSSTENYFDCCFGIFHFLFSLCAVLAYKVSLLELNLQGPAKNNKLYIFHNIWCK